MIKEKINSNKGITLVSLVVTIVIMLILTTISVSVPYNRFKVNNMNKMLNDLELLRDKVSNYYFRYSSLPIVKNSENNPIIYNYKELEFAPNPNDNEKYFIIDLEAMEGITLNYGLEGFNNPNASDDVYIINERTHNIYYAKGIEIEGEKYYYIVDKNESGDIIYSKPEIKIISGERNSEGIYTTEVNIEIMLGEYELSGDNETTCLCNFTDKNGNVEEILNEKIINNKVIKLENSGTYEFIVTRIDESGNTTTIEQTIKINIQQPTIKLADVIIPENYGDVIEYEANGVEDWKIFFNDGNNVFIISSKYIPATSIPENSKMISDNTYKITWEPIYGAPRPGFEGHAPIVRDITENSKILERAQTFKYEWLQENVDKDWNKVAAAKDLLNNDVWNVFAEGLEGAQAIGAPTLEMFAESWQQKNYGKLTYSCNENGYLIGDNGEWLSLVGGKGYQDTLYFPYQLNNNQEDIEWANSTQCVAYWLASVSSKDNHCLLCVDGYGGMFPDWYSAFYLGLRPVVCLPSDAVATIKEGLWTNLTTD